MIYVVVPVLRNEWSFSRLSNGSQFCLLEGCSAVNESEDGSTEIPKQTGNRRLANGPLLTPAGTMVTSGILGAAALVWLIQVLRFIHVNCKDYFETYGKPDCVKKQFKSEIEYSLWSQTRST